MITIALFGSEETIQLVTPFELKVEGIRLDSFRYQSVTDLEVLLPKAKECDVYLFSGILPYTHAERLLGTFDKPAIYIDDSELNISLTLLTVLSERLASFDRISIDLPDRKKLDSIVQQLQLQPAPTYVQDFAWLKEKTSRPFNSDILLNYHLNLWNEKNIDLAITSIHAVYDQLAAQGIPCLRIVDADATIMEALQKSKEAALFNQAEWSRIAACLISVHSNTSDTCPPEHIQAVFTQLKELAKRIQGELQQIDESTFEYFGTKGSIQFLMEKPLLLEPLLSVASRFSLHYQAGAGYGMTMVEAKKNAEIAITYTEKNRHSFIVVTEEKVVLHPQSPSKSETLSSHDTHIVYLAKAAKVSVPNLIKMMQFLDSRPVNRITSEDISDYFAITKRSAERMLKKYMDVGWLVVIGEEQPHQNGRPRSIYRLDFPQP